MPKQIKRGLGTLIGNAGEFYVAAELLKRGIIAALAPRNAPSFDILATNGAANWRIRVKTKSAEYTDWQWMTKKDGTIFRDISKENDFTVLVNLTTHTRDMEYFVVPTRLLKTWLVKDFDTWAKTPGKNKRPHDATTKKRNLKYPKFERLLRKYSNAWEQLQ